MKIIIKRIRLIVVLWILYAFISGVLVLKKPKKLSADYINRSSLDRFYSDKLGPDRGILIDNPLDAGLARLKIIDSAKESLNISYFSIESGEAPNLFFGALIDAADRGVEVNILLDGLFHGLKGSFKPILYIIKDHPNINLKFYEPLNLFKPWTLNNRMHDKYIIADHKIAIIGGRNIGDKYFAPEWYDDKITNDRDIIIINSRSQDQSSVIYQMSQYFQEIWNHKFSKEVSKNLFKFQSRKAKDKSRELKDKFYKAKEINQDTFQQSLDLIELSFPINKASFIHNPIERFSKEPWVWYEISQLIKSAKKSIFLQSPYIIPSKEMVQGFINETDIKDIEVTALTNSLASTPNLPAYSGYLGYRKGLIDKGIDIYEYQSTDSLHTKSYIIDDDLLIIGSFNTDPRSTFLSTESMLVIHSKQAVGKIEEGLDSYISRSLLVSPDYNYIDRDGIDLVPVSQIKEYTIKILSYLTKWFDFLL